MKIKVCGMKYKENMELVAGLHPDYLGFIFYERSKRNFKGIIPKFNGQIRKVGVFVNEQESVINDLIQKHQLNAVQLHGDESTAFCKNLKASNGPDLEIIKAFAISENFDFNVLDNYMQVCDYYLFDTKGKERGGNGTLFDWKLLEQYRFDKPFFLSGGIGIAELNQINSFLKSELSVHCYGIDVNSKFESEPGMKKISELKKFIDLTAKEN